MNKGLLMHPRRQAQLSRQFHVPSHLSLLTKIDRLRLQIPIVSHEVPIALILGAIVPCMRVVADLRCRGAIVFIPVRRWRIRTGILPGADVVGGHDVGDEKEQGSERPGQLQVLWKKRAHRECRGVVRGD